MGDYDSNPQVKLAVHMFAYRLRKAIGSYLAALGSADAIIFEEGSVRQLPHTRTRLRRVRGFGLEIDHEANRTLIDTEGMLLIKLSKPGMGDTYPGKPPNRP